jgi:hypothetical protein
MPGLPLTGSGCNVARFRERDPASSHVPCRRNGRDRVGRLPRVGLVGGRAVADRGDADLVLVVGEHVDDAVSPYP